VPFFIVLVAKLVASVFVYNVLSMGSSDSYWMSVNWDTQGQNEVLRSVADQGLKWPYVFMGWDSAWYLAIVEKGYAFSSLSYAFFPGLPLFSWLVNMIVQNAAVALIAFSFILGVLWIPLYQLVIENYQDKGKAVESTLFFAFFPYVFLFTSVSYAEGLFLFSTLGAWYFFKKEKMLQSMLFASVAAVSRAPGFVIILPIFIEIVQRYRHSRSPLQLKKIVYMSIPSSCLMAWLLILASSGWFPPTGQTGWSGMYSFRVLILEVLPQKGAQALLNYFDAAPFSVLFISFLSVAPFLIFALKKIDKSLSIYAAVYFLGVLAFGGLASIPRFVSFIFPLWFPLTFKMSQTKHSTALTLFACAVFFAIGLFLWYSFLIGEFVS
jgi:hypothetical protein